MRMLYNRIALEDLQPVALNGIDRFFKFKEDFFLYAG